MGTNLANWVRALPPDHRYQSTLSQLLEAYENLDNFEGILADLMTCPLESPAAKLPRGARGHLLEDLVESLIAQFEEIRTAPAPLYDLLAKRIRPGDIVITFNYDLGIERSLASAGLWNVSAGYGFSISDVEQQSPVELLKLHGSANWRALLFGGRQGFGLVNNSLGDRPVLFFQADLEYLGFNHFVDPLCRGLEGAASLPAMILPALPKKFSFETPYGHEWKAFWDRLWKRAECAIESAEELLIIGYSLPEADQRARTLLLRGTNRAVPLTICCDTATRRLEQEFLDSQPVQGL